MPPYGLPSYGIKTPQSFFNRQFSSYFGDPIVIEPDMDVRGMGVNHGYERNTGVGALPMYETKRGEKMWGRGRRWRWMGVGVVVLGVVGFVLGILVVLAGRERGVYGGQFLVKLNTSRVGQDIIRFERASSSAAAATRTATSRQLQSTAAPTQTTTLNPLDSLNPFSTASPLNPANPDNPLHSLAPAVDSLLGNLMDSVNDGLGDALDQIVEGLVDEVGVQDFYYLYLSGICEGNFGNGTGVNKDGVLVGKCVSWSDASASFHSSFKNVQSSIVVGLTNISVPLIADLTQGIGGVSSTLSGIRTALFAFLIIGLTTSLLTVLLAIPSVFFPDSRLLIITNVLVSDLACISSFVSAVLITTLVVVVPWAIGDLLAGVGVVMSRGETVLAFLWVKWGCCQIIAVYWTTVWFVEVRRSSFFRRTRTGDEIGNWKGILGEIRRDLKGAKEL
ncbi:unnamed protein product [Periconia digitata]|uniref:Uncharacterized protein n=1 Tax=Periconia digitata TaxID=1303443 RepID=A0A9W4UN01_9PLEO|nr:unnamed protein product [Periconia digitata]